MGTTPDRPAAVPARRPDPVRRDPGDLGVKQPSPLAVQSAAALAGFGTNLAPFVLEAVRQNLVLGQAVADLSPALVARHFGRPDRANLARGLDTLIQCRVIERVDTPVPGHRINPRYHEWLTPSGAPRFNPEECRFLGVFQGRVVTDYEPTPR